MTIQLSLRRLDPEDERPDFDCGDPDLNEFFKEDSIRSGNELLSVTYIAESDSGDVLAFFSVSNDSIREEDAPSKTRFRKKILQLLPHDKRYKSTPAVKIGRFAVCNCQKGDGIGTRLVDFIKAWFTVGNKTGCRFLLVDAYNNQKTTHFYEKNGFEFLSQEAEDGDETRTMYFDLMRFKESQQS